MAKKQTKTMLVQQAKPAEAQLTRMQTASQWMIDNWRSVAFIVYCTICLFDFIIMPGIYEFSNKVIDPEVAVKLAKQFDDSTVQLEIIKQLTTKRAWTPLTMDGAASFHIAFGAILGAASWTRGQEKIEQAKRPRIPGGAPSVTPDNPDA